MRERNRFERELQDIGIDREVSSFEKTQWIQAVLNATGERLNVDGTFASSTLEAVKRFQSRYGLQSNGIVDPITETALIQRALNVIAKKDKLKVNGIKDSKTSAEIMNFQSTRKLMADGIVGPQTRAAMIAALVPTTQPWKPPTTTTTTLPISPPSAGATAAVDEPLPANGRGYYSYSPEANTQYGRKQTIDALVRIGETWFSRYPSGPKIGIGHISRKGGGDFPPHKSHRDGVDVDIRPLRQDHKQDPTNWKDPSYNRALTRDLVNLIRSTARIRSILFNDPELGQEKIVQDYSGHDDHLHTSFERL